MPVYEYLCSNCNKRFSALIGMTAEKDDERCPKCRSANVRRLISKPAKVRTEDQRLDEMADRLETMGEPSSYRELRKTVRELGDALDDGAADEIEEMLEADLEEQGADEPAT